MVLALLFSVIQLRTINKLKKKFLPGEDVESSKAEYSIDSDLSEQKGISEQLRTQLKAKTIELAKVAKGNTERKQVLEEVKNKLLSIKESPHSTERIVNDVIQKIDAISSNTEDTFEIQIDELNQQFYKKLKEKYPDLTVNDLRLSAYIKMGLDSKEIANLLNIKPSSIYINRSRFRKKLGLDPEADLFDFLNS